MQEKKPEKFKVEFYENQEIFLKNGATNPVWNIKLVTSWWSPSWKVSQ